jgi:hypothetical protein
MLLLVASTCWTRPFAPGYWLFYFSSVLFWLRWGKKTFAGKRLSQVSMYFALVNPCPCGGQSTFVTVGSYIVSNQLIAGSIMVTHMKLILVLSLPLGVYYFMKCLPNTLWGGIMTSFDSTWPYFWLCLLFLATSARVDTGWYVHTFSVHHGFDCLFETWVARVLKVTVISTDCLVL